MGGDVDFLEPILRIVLGRDVEHPVFLGAVWDWDSRKNRYLLDRIGLRPVENGLGE
jgi:hypothetical protein